VLVGGALVVSAAPASAVDVSTEPQLRDAFDDEAQVDLVKDITLVDCSVDAGAVTRSVGTPVVVDGHGFTITQTCSATIFELDNAVGADVTLQEITLTGGRERDDGGAIDMNDGDLTVLRSTLTGNCALSDAGAIENEDGDTTIIESTLSNNRADDTAGAVRSKRGNTTIVNSTITGNSQALNGAVDSGQPAADASLTLVYTDVVDNVVDATPSCDVAAAALGATVDDEVGAQQDMMVANVYVVNAFSTFGSVIALPSGGPNCFVETGTTSLGYNFSDDDTCGFTETTDTEDGPDPQLGALADNGGPTPTRLPALTSPLVNAIPIDACGDGDGLAGFAVTTDQRGITRPQETGCEIGSVELEAPVPPPAPIVLEPTFTG
jgi:hypothetical protein